MDVSIAICTRNRAASLARVLESLVAMNIPDGLRWEVIVVNNGSTDETDAVIARYQNRLPLRREFEAKPGKSNACNHAVAVAKGAYMVWTDDDVIVDPCWLSAYVDAFREFPDSVLFGGKIIPLFDEPMPPWLRECWVAVGGAFAHRDFGDDPVPLAVAGNRMPYGANFAVRTAEQRAYRYDPALGPGTAAGLGEETDLMLRMLKDGITGYWVPLATVRHCISHARQTTRYIRDFHRKVGRLKVIGRDDRLDGPRLFGAPRYLSRQLITDYCKYRLRRWTSPSSVWIRDLLSYANTRAKFEFHRESSRLRDLALVVPRRHMESRLGGDSDDDRNWGQAKRSDLNGNRPQPSQT